MANPFVPLTRSSLRSERPLPASGEREGFDTLKVQVRQNFRWVDVRRLRINSPCPHDRSAGPNKRYVLDFVPTWGDGVRIIGKPRGAATFTTLAELEAYYAG